jgi:hypothetical protein
VCSRTRTLIGPDVSASVKTSAAARAPWRGRKGKEEGVSLGVDLDTALYRTGLADQTTMLGQRHGIRLGTQLVQQAGRALDVGEQERHCAGGTLSLGHAARRLAPPWLLRQHARLRPTTRRCSRDGLAAEVQASIAGLGYAVPELVPLGLTRAEEVNDLTPAGD